MKSYLKLLMAIILVLSCIAVFASCGDDEQQGGNDSTGDSGRPDIEIVIPPDSETEETYLVQFVYRYYLTYINDFDRMESKAFTERKVTLEIPLENSGFTAEQIAQIEGIKHNGYSFDGWYIGWDEDNYKVDGEKFDFATDNAKITSDMTFYADRGILAGENATWAITVEGEGKAQETILTISGTGATFDYEAVTNIDIPWYSERAKITKVVIGEGITHVGANSFNGLYAADEVVYPSTLETIGTAAFRGMTKLTSLETPENLKSIGVSAFAETSLKSVILNEGLEEILDTAFNETNKIVSIVVPTSLKMIKTGAFHPGSTDGKVNSSALKYVYYLGSEEQFAKIDIGLDNPWFNELASVYCKLPEGTDPATVKGPYWDYYSYEGADGATVETGIPVPYYYMIKYTLNSSVYGRLTPIAVDYAPTSVVVNEDGTLTVSAYVDAANVQFANDLTYHNFKFVRYTNGVTEGLKLTDDRSVTCEVYTNTRVSPSATATGSNKGYLSENGGLVWEFSFATRTLTISLGAEAPNAENVAAILAKIGDYKGEITGESVISDILGVISAADVADIASAAGLSSAEEFAALANKLAALELSNSNDPLIATAEVLASVGIVTADDLVAFIASMEAEGAAENADLQANIATLAAASLDSQNLKDLSAKLAAAGVSGSIADEFNAIKTTLAALEAKDVLITDIHASMIARENAIAKIAEATIKSFAVGDAAKYDSAITVADLVAAIDELQVDARLFATWDYATTEDTSVMWASSRSYTDYVSKVVINDGVKHLGSNLFASLTSLTEIVIPASVTSIDATAFTGCSSLINIYYAGTDLASVKILDAAREGKELGTLYDNDPSKGSTRLLQGNYAHAFAYTDAATAEDGKYWMNIGDSKIAWSLIAGKLRVGGPSVMVDFESAEAAPWYGAKDSITKVTIANNVTHIGENIANGYANVTSIDISESYGTATSIPASAFAGTGFVTDESNYNKDGLLLIDDGVNIYVLGYNGDAEFVRIPNYTVSIVEGAFDNNANFDQIYLPQTILGLHANTFTNNVPTIIFFKGSSDSWGTTCGNLVFPEDAEYYVALSERKDTDNPDFFFSFVQEGNDFIIVDGCIHEYTDWVETVAPTCSKTGEKQRTCTGTCGKTFTQVVPALGHEWSAWAPCADAPTYEERWCQNANCDSKCSVEGCTLHADHADDCADDCTAHKQAAHEKVMINSEYTFEGIDAVNDNQIKLSDTTNSKYTIVEIGTDAHAFEYEKTSNEVSAPFTVYATQAGTLASAKVVTYQSALKIDNTNKKVSIDLVFCSEADPSVKAIALNLLATDGKNLDIGSKSGEYVSAGVKTGDWFTIKVEYYTEGDVAVAKAYVNDKFVYATNAIAGDAIVSAGVADSVSFVPSANYLGKISLDNVTLVQGTDYEFDGVTSMIKPITYDEIPPASLVKVSGTATIVTKDDNKYYSLDRGSTPTGHYIFYSQSNANSANVAIFETDLQITRTAGSRAWAIRFEGGPSSNAYMAEFRHDATTGTLYVADKSRSEDNIGYKTAYVQPTDADGNPVKIQVGDWVNVRIEYYEAKAGDAESVRILTYVNDVLVLYSNNWYGVSTEHESAGANVPHPAKVSEITDAYIQPYTSHRGEWNVDNTVFYKTFAQAPTDPVTLKYDDFSGGAMNDGDGNVYLDYAVEDDRAKALKNLVNEVVDDNEDIFVPEAPAFGTPIDFEDLDALPAFIAHNSGDGTLTVAEEGGNKFFRVTEGKNSTRFIMSLTEKKVEGANSVVFETRMRYNLTRDGGNGATNMFLITDNNTGSRAFEFQFNYNTANSNNVMISTREGTDAAGNTTTQVDFGTDSTDTGIALNEWFDLKLVYTDDGKLTVYINDEVVLETTNYYTKNVAPVDAEAIDGAWFVPFGSTVGNIDFDNLAFYHVAAEADEDEPETPDEPVVPEEIVKIPVGATTFDGATAFPVVGDVVTAVNETQFGASQYTDADGVKQTVYDESGKAIPQFKGTVSLNDGYIRIVDVSAKSITVANTDPELAKTEDVGQAILRFNGAVTEGNVAVFQVRMRINPLEDGSCNYSTSGAGIDIRLNTTGNKNGMALMVYAQAGMIEICDKTTSTNKVRTTAAVGDWFTLTFYYTYDPATSTSVAYATVVDKDEVETKLSDMTTNNAAATEVYRSSVIFNKPFQGIADFDNVFIGSAIEYPAVEEPKPEYLPEGALTFDDMAAGDWTTNGTGSVLVGLGKQTGATIEPVVAVVTEGDTKYLNFTKTNGETVKMSWLVFQNNSNVTTADGLYFETKMRMTKLGGNNETHIRFYKDRKVSAPADGTEVSSAARLKITAADNKLAIGGIDTGLAANEWFVLRLVITTDSVTVYVAGADGEFSPVTSISADFSTYSALQFTNQNNDQTSFDFDWAYYGVEPAVSDDEETPDEPEIIEPEEEVLEGTNTFEDVAEGNYIFDATQATKINHIISGANAKGETKIVVDADGNKYFQMVKTQGGSSNAQTWINVERTMAVPEGTPVVFESKMNIVFTNGSSAYLRFYTGRPADGSATGTCAGVTSNGTATNNGNVMFNYATAEGASSKTLHIDTSYAKIDLGVKQGDWFTIRLVMSGKTITVYIADENGAFVEKGKIERPEWKFDLSECTTVTYMQDSSCTMSVGMDNVYFGPYVADVESPIENLPIRETELAADTITFNSIEETELPENIVTLMDETSTLSVVAVSRSNKVLALDKAAGADARVYLNATKKTVGANVLTFATQMYFDKIEADGYVDLTLMPSGSAEDDRVYKVRIAANAEGNFTIAPIALVDGADVVGEAVDAGVKVGEWFKLSIVYTESNNKFVVSVNGEAKITSDAAYGMFKDASAISQVLIYANDALAADVYFENMRLSQTIAD